MWGSTYKIMTHDKSMWNQLNNYKAGMKSVMHLQYLGLSHGPQFVTYLIFYSFKKNVKLWNCIMVGIS